MIIFSLVLFIPSRSYCVFKTTTQKWAILNDLLLITIVTYQHIDNNSCQQA